MTIFELRVPTKINRPMPRTIVSHLVTTPVLQGALMSLTANSWDGAAGRFTSSPWEGLRWEADPPTKASCDEGGTLDETLGRFLINLMYGE
ncbi:MAG: hypothetical protein ABWY04_00510 [Arthrobacter sp.]